MENSYKYFKNKNCKYFPCHKGLSDDFNCLFCYCPMYSMPNCPGSKTYIEKNGKKIKVCTDCTFPHRPENYDKIIQILIRNNNNWFMDFSRSDVPQLMSLAIQMWMFWKPFLIFAKIMAYDIWNRSIRTGWQWFERNFWMFVTILRVMYAGRDIDNQLNIHTKQ